MIGNMSRLINLKLDSPFCGFENSSTLIDSIIIERIHLKPARTATLNLEDAKALADESKIIIAYSLYIKKNPSPIHSVHCRCKRDL